MKADLGDRSSVAAAVEGADVVVHLAGVLFAPRAARFLPITNVQWFANLVDVALAARVRKVVLASFPQVEGPTTIDNPATGRLDREPISVHARTRLEAERLLMSRTRGTSTIPVILRLGVVYGDGVLLIEAARRLARLSLLCVWREPTVIQLIAVPDYLRATAAAIGRDDVSGIYHVGDDRPVTIQEFLDRLCATWGYRRPWRVPMWSVRASAWLCELFASVRWNARAADARYRHTRQGFALGRHEPRAGRARAGAHLFRSRGGPEAFRIGRNRGLLINP